MDGSAVVPGVDRPQARRGSLAGWVTLCAAAEGVGMTAASAAAVSARSWVVEPASGSGRALVLLLVVAGGLIEGLALGTAQAIGLRRWVPRLNRRSWVAVTVAIAGIRWALASTPSVLAAEETGTERPTWLFLLGAAALGAAMGLVLGGAQALVLRGTVTHPARWVGANALAWSATMLVIFLGSSAPGPDWTPAGVIALGAGTGVAAGAVLGLVTGCFLPSLAGSSVVNRIVLRVLRSRVHRLLDRSVLGLQVRGVVTGVHHALPVMYAVGPAGLVVFPGHAERKRWWRNLQRPALVSVLYQGRWQAARGELLWPGGVDFDVALSSYQRRWPRVPIGPGEPLVHLLLLAPRQPSGHGADQAPALVAEPDDGPRTRRPGTFGSDLPPPGRQDCRHRDELTPQQRRKATS